MFDPIRVTRSTDETTRMVERLEASATMSLDPANIYANEERSTAMRDAFDRLAATGFGEYRPVNAEDSSAARAQNRRIELKLTER